MMVDPILPPALLSGEAPMTFRRMFLLCCSGLLLAACSTTKPPVLTAPALLPALPAMVVPKARPIRIGLALGGGAARGFAHIGVIKAL